MQEKSWHFDPDTERKAALANNPDADYLLLDATPKDVQKTIHFYQNFPVPGYEIASVQVIYNRDFNLAFTAYLKQQQRKKGKAAFESKWQFTMSEPVFRQQTHALLEQMSAPHKNAEYPDVKLIPAWHGTKLESLDGIFTIGYSNLAFTDSGFFGNGLYSTYEAEYAYRVYSKGALILNWVACFSALPVIDGDVDLLKGGGNYGAYDAHFAPVVPANPNNSNEKIYYPCKPGQKHQYTEIVVFQTAACLPRFLVTLQSILPKAPVQTFEEAVALYDFTDQTPGVLSFKAGQILKILSKQGDWWQAECDGKVGVIPSNYVQTRLALSPMMPSCNHEAEITSLKQALVQKESQLTQQETQLTQQASSLNQQLKQIHQLTQVLQVKDATITAQEKALKELEVLRAKYADLEKTLQVAKAKELQLEAELEKAKQKPVTPIKTINPPNVVPSVFQPLLNQPLKFSEQVQTLSNQVASQINPQDLTALLKWVTEGHLIEAEKLLQKNRCLALATGTVTDLSGRMFKGITALQYAAWALDIEMCELIIKYLEPQNASIQLKALSNESGCYSPHGSCYDIEPLITKTKTYLDNYSSWDNDKCRQYWQKEVGGEQRKCPAWLIYAWSEEGENVAWTKKDLKRKINREYDKYRLLWWMTENYNSGRGVGSSWAVARGGSMCVCATPALVPGIWAHDFENLQFCRQSRHESLDRLKANLNSPSAQIPKGPGK